MDIAGVGGVTGVGRLQGVGPINTANSIPMMKATSANGTDSQLMKIAEDTLKRESIDVNFTVRSVDDVKKIEAETLQAVEHTKHSHAIYLKETARLAQKYNDNNAFLYNSSGGKHLFDAVGQEIDVKL